MKDKVCISVTNSNLLNRQREEVVLKTKASRLASVMLLPALSKDTSEENNAVRFSDEIAERTH